MLHLTPASLLLALALAAAMPSVADTAAPVVITPVEAVEQAVTRRFGPGVRVVVTTLDTDVAGEPALQAVPDPAARTGQPARFQLLVNGVRRGAAVASVQVLAPHARAARAIDRGETLSPTALAVVDGELSDALFQPLPAMEELVGLRARRTIAVGESLTPALLEVPPLVQSGDKVTVTLRVGAIEATSTGTASGSGREGDVIRVIQPESRRLLRARITGHALVEVIP